MNENIQGKEEEKSTLTKEKLEKDAKDQEAIQSNTPALIRSGKRVNSNFLPKHGHPRWYSSPKLSVETLPDDQTQRGVFATDNFKAYDVLEEVPFINIDNWYESKELFNFLRSSGLGNPYLTNTVKMSKAFNLRSVHEYLFNWSGTPEDDDSVAFAVIPLGKGSLYNTSPHPNTEWLTTRDSFIFRTIEKVKKGQELRTFYGYFVTESGKKVTASNVLGMYVELNETNRVCLRAMPPEEASSLSPDKVIKLNEDCRKGDVLINEINFFTAGKELAASLKAAKVNSTDFFYQKVIEAKIQTQFSYLDMELQYTFDKNKKEIVTLFNR